MRLALTDGRRRSAVRGGEPARDASAQVGFRTDGADVHAALDQRVDQRADDFSPIQRFPGSGARRQTIEVQDLTVEQNDRDLGPGLAVHRRPSGTGL